MQTLVIVPTYNERENLGALVSAVLEQVDGVEILVVDDASPDGTGALADRLAENSAVHVLHRAGKSGLGSAYVAGFRWAMERGFTAVVQMDADFSHDPRYLPGFVNGLRDHDGVVGSRYIPGGATENWRWGRRLVSRGGNLYARLILGSRLADLTGGFNAWRCEVLDAVGLDSLNSTGYAFQIELKHRVTQLGFEMVELPIRFEDRRVGQSKMGVGVAIEAVYRVWQFRLTGPTKTPTRGPGHD